MSDRPNQDPYSNQPPYPNQVPYQNYGNSAPPPSYSGTPQGPYGYGAPPGYSPNMPPASTPLPLGEAIRQLPSQYIRVVSKPGAAVFAAEQGKAAWNIIWVQLIAVAILSVLFGFAFFNLTFASALNGQNIPPETIARLRGIFNGLPFSYIVLTPIGFFIGVGIYHLLAKAFGGQGTFLAFAYCYLLFYVPLTIAEGVLGLIPFVGGLIAFALGIYGIVLQIFMTMGVHRLSGGRATLAVLILPIIAIVLAIILVIVLFAVIAAALHNR